MHWSWTPRRDAHVARGQRIDEEFTVEPVPMPMSMPSRTYRSAACGGALLLLVRIRGQRKSCK